MRNCTNTTSIGTHRWLIWQEIALSSLQSDWSFIDWDSASTRLLSAPSRCWATMWIFLSRAHIHNSFVRRIMSLETVPPWLLM